MFFLLFFQVCCCILSCHASTSSHTAPVHCSSSSSLLLAGRTKLPYVAWKATIDLFILWWSFVDRLFGSGNTKPIFHIICMISNNIFKPKKAGIFCSVSTTKKKYGDRGFYDPFSLFGPHYNHSLLLSLLTIIAKKNRRRRGRKRVTLDLKHVLRTTRAYYTKYHVITTVCK